MQQSSVKAKSAKALQCVERSKREQYVSLLKRWHRVVEKDEASRDLVWWTQELVYVERDTSSTS